MEGVRELENHRLTRIVIQVGSGNSHWKINLKGAFDPGTRYFHGLRKCSPSLLPWDQKSLPFRVLIFENFKGWELVICNSARCDLNS